MSFSKISVVAGAVAFASGVAAHGHVSGASIDGTYYEGYNPSFQYYSTPPVVIGWSTPDDLSNGYIAPDAYATSDINCHLNATPAGTSAPIKAGESINIQWTDWPSSHHGPVLTYMANCNGNCSSVDKTTLEWFKIDESGLIDDTSVPGTWASDNLISNNNSWTSTIPSDIASGNYVIRNEIIALHSAGTADGAQNYPMCLNVEVTGTGSATPSGVLGTALYKESDAGIIVNIYQSLSTYDIPGPTLYSGAVTASQTGAASSATATGAASSAAVTTSAASSVATSSAAAVTSAAASTTAAATTSVASSSAVSSATAAPTSVSTVGKATGNGTSTTTDPMPAGTTLQDLLSWLYSYVESAVRSTTTTTKRDTRGHARAFVPRA